MKIILITGASSGLGRELSLLYSSEESHIILLGRSLEKLNAVSKAISDKGYSSEPIACDISDYKSIDNIYENLKNKYGKIDYLINCAGVGHFGDFLSYGIEEIDQMIDINVKGTIFMTRAFLPIVSDRIINIISTAGLRAKINESVYVASKFAIRGFTESLQKEYNNLKPEITSVYMGGMDTAFWDDSNHIKDKSRLRSPKDVAKLIKSSDDGRQEIIIE